MNTNDFAHEVIQEAARLRARLSALESVERLAKQAYAALDSESILILEDASGSSIRLSDLVEPIRDPAIVSVARRAIRDALFVQVDAILRGDSPATPPAAVEQQPTPNPEPSAVRSTAAEDSTPLDGLPESVARGLEESPSTMMDPGARPKAYMAGREHAMRGGARKQPWKVGTTEAQQWALGYDEAKQLIADEPGFIKAQPEAEPEADVQPIPEPEPVAKPARKGGLF